MKFSLAHVSDPHLPLPVGPPLWSLTGKQALALVSWRRKRRHVTSLDVLAALRTDLATQPIDHVAVTGDLVNLALPAEFAAAADWLATLGAAADVSVIPGNHEMTRRVEGMRGLGLWSNWSRGDDGVAGWPFLRRRGPVALIGLSSAIAPILFDASGRVGTRQRAQVAAWLDEAGRDRLFRVVLMHHPPVIGPGGRRKALRDRAAMAELLLRHGAELVLHGHHHIGRLAMLPGPGAPIPVLGVASASAGVERPQLAGWSLHRIEQEAAGWRLTTIRRGYDPVAGRFAPQGEWSIRYG